MTAPRRPRSRSGSASRASAASRVSAPPLAGCSSTSSERSARTGIRQLCSLRRRCRPRPWPGRACGSSGSSSATARQLVGDADEVLDDAVVQLGGDASRSASTRSSARRTSCSRSRSCCRARRAWSIASGSWMAEREEHRDTSTGRKAPHSSARLGVDAVRAAGTAPRPRSRPRRRGLGGRPPPAFARALEAILGGAQVRDVRVPLGRRRRRAPSATWRASRSARARPSTR